MCCCWFFQIFCFKENIRKTVAFLIGVYGQISVLNQELLFKSWHESSIPFLPEIHKIDPLEKKAVKQQAMNTALFGSHWAVFDLIDGNLLRLNKYVSNKYIFLWLRKPLRIKRYWENTQGIYNLFACIDCCQRQETPAGWTSASSKIKQTNNLFESSMLLQTWQDI